MNWLIFRTLIEIPSNVNLSRQNLVPWIYLGKREQAIVFWIVFPAWQNFKINGDIKDNPQVLGLRSYLIMQ